MNMFKNEPLLKIDSYTFFYPNEPAPALDGVSLTVARGDFFVLFGRSGCGKSTLLRSLKPTLAPHGERFGAITLQGDDVFELSTRETVTRIGFVSQSPDNQLVTDKVWHELAFGLEGLGTDTPTIRKRVAEMASFFGIEDWFHRDVASLSGGQKQLLNLASVMTMQPELLILDEPTSQLDPIAASDFFATLGRINSELGTTIILTEHRLEEALSICTKCAYMKDGRILESGGVTDIALSLRESGDTMFCALPAAMQIWNSLGGEGECPVSVNEGRRFLESYLVSSPQMNCEGHTEPVSTEAPKEAVVYVKDITFRYPKSDRNILKNLSFEAHRGSLHCLMGGNGAGKSTLLKLIAGILSPLDGSVSVKGTIGYLPQNPQLLFSRKSVREELANPSNELLSLCRLEGLENRHPFDLSGGEQQRLALAKLLLGNPELLLLDEPTKGMDAEFKLIFADIIKDLLEQKVCIIMVSHDIDFCARYGTYCSMLFDGAITSTGTRRDFFDGNSFYTTSVNRMTRGLLKGCICPEDVVRLFEISEPTAQRTNEQREVIAGLTGLPACGRQKTVTGHFEARTAERSTPAENKAPKTTALPLWRRLLAGICGVGIIVLFIYVTKRTDLTTLLTGGNLAGGATQELVVYGILIALLTAVILLTARRSEKRITHISEEKTKHRLTKRTRMAVLSILLMIPVTLFVSVVYLGKEYYYLTAVLVLLESMLPFFMIFEKRKPRARELVTIASLSALAIAGRAAFFMVPQFKPVTALTIIAGVALGGESGFLVGAMTMLASNVLFSQGPWTPWQMFTMGIIGFLAGVLYKKGLLARSRLSLCVFGAISTLVIYGGIMNLASALIWAGSSLNLKILLSYYITGFPMDLVHAAATFAFLWFLADPMLEKLDRVKEKYGLEEA